MLGLSRIDDILWVNRRLFLKAEIKRRIRSRILRLSKKIGTDGVVYLLVVVYLEGCHPAICAESQ